MKKRFWALFLLLCLLPLTALADFDPDHLFQKFLKTPAMPDMKAYAEAQLKEGGQETESYLIYRKFSGKPSTVAAVAEAYVQLLQDEYKCVLIGKNTVDCGNYARIGYALSCGSAVDLSEFYVYGEEDGRSWESVECNVYVQYTIPDSGTSYIHFYYSPEFSYGDQGDRYVKETGSSEKVSVTATSKPQATEKPDATTSATK